MIFYASNLAGLKKSSERKMSLFAKRSKIFQKLIMASIERKEIDEDTFNDLQSSSKEILAEFDNPVPEDNSDELTNLLSKALFVTLLFGGLTLLMSFVENRLLGNLLIVFEIIVFAVIVLLRRKQLCSLIKKSAPILWNS